jgi:poly-gamma-glutamate synthase PgsB/CapB
MNRIIKSKNITISLAEVSQLISHNRPPFWLQLNASLLKRILAGFKDWPLLPTLESEQRQLVDGQKTQRIVEFLLHEATQTQAQLTRLSERYSLYSQRYVKAVNEDEKQAYILEYARELGSTSRALRQDKRAFKRWFGHDAVSDRYRRQHLENERYLSFILDCLGRLAALVLHTNGEAVGFNKLWQRLELERVLQPLLQYRGDERVVISAFKALSLAIQALPTELKNSSLKEGSLRFIYQAALKNTQSVWIQCEALLLVLHAKPEQLLTILNKRFTQAKSNDDLFVRRKAVEIIGKQIIHDNAFIPLLDLASKDISPAVRQKIPEILPELSLDLIQLYSPILLADESEPVRASALLGLLPLLARVDCFSVGLSLLADFLAKEQQKFPLRTALLLCRQGLDQLLEHQQQDKIDVYLHTLLPAIERLHQQADSLSVRRWAAQTREYLLCISQTKTHASFIALSQFVKTITPGKSKRLPKHLIIKDETELGRVLALIAQQDFGFDIEKNAFGYFLSRGHSFGFRCWRFLYEFRHPSPDKRQGFSHTVGRLFWGQLHIPSAILSELAETKVPGEPLFISTEDGWREYLPLLDEVLSALSIGVQETRIYHSEGLTLIQPPKPWFKRWRARWLITFRFSEYAHLRNWQEQDQQASTSYFQALAKLGIQVSYQGHNTEHWQETSEDPAVLRFFPAFLPLEGSHLWDEFKDYFISVYENSLYELAVYTGLACTYFVGRHLYLYHKIKVARNRLPLVIGGWGTRGKSGTERIKAAVINALGHSIISKTTGCEAMFIHSHPFGELREMFLFRPYDKATIWEQHNLVCLADQFKTEVFLWECMGLTPSYIEILQRQWMRDDISTITNTYPDHEDLQGPAGINIPQVMAKFIPKNSIILTTEEQMRPILEHAAQECGSKFRSVDWLQAGLLSDDVLARFPYDEHPYNIALVLAMSEEIGVEYDFALKEMADRVIADIGVLKTYPCALWRSRRLEFINGMSANERFGCLGNWQRMGLDKLSIEEQPDTWVVSVVNNRADRVARSRVFASILAQDISFDRCVLIGNNLAGMQSYIKEAWAEWIAGIDLFNDKEAPDAILLRVARWFRIPYNEDLVKMRLQYMLAGQTTDIDLQMFLQLLNQPEALALELAKQKILNDKDIVSFLAADLQLLASYQVFAQSLSSKTHKELQSDFKVLLWQWFSQKIVVVEDYHATGNQVIETIGTVTPPGFYARIIGMQNIKGTGLDFVYRWQAWEICYKACQQLASPIVAESNKGLSTLAAFQEYGIVAEETVRSTVATVKESMIAQNEHYQAELALIIANLDYALGALKKQNIGQVSGNSWLNYIISSLEAFLDAGDAVKRRKLANVIYQDLIVERVSHERAALELQKINKGQKGGWLNLSK